VQNVTIKDKAFVKAKVSQKIDGNIYPGLAMRISEKRES
jgi:hypothetical protein